MKNNVIVLFISLSVSLLLAEGVIRIIKPPMRGQVDGEMLPTNGGPLKSHGEWNQYAHHRPIPGWKGKRRSRDWKEDDEDGILDVRLEYNSLGIRGPEIPPKTGPRVLLIGDSFMEADELSFEENIGTILNQRDQPEGGDVVQHGFTTWSPITMFAWFYHFGQSLEVDRVYMLTMHHDFVSPVAFSKADPTYRTEYRFNGQGHPLVIPHMKVSALGRASYLVRFIESWIESIANPRQQLTRLYHDPRPFSVKMGLLYDRIFYKKTIFPNSVSYSVAEMSFSPLFKQGITDEKLIREHWKRLHYEITTLRLPSSEWDDTITQSVESTVQSIRDFNQYLQKMDTELVVVMVPDGFDIDRNEHDASNEFRRGYDHSHVDSLGLINHLKTKLGQFGVSLLDLKPVLTQYKAKNCHDCKNFLYFKNDGHWNAEAHRVIADKLEDHFEKNPIRSNFNLNIKP